MPRRSAGLLLYRLKNGFPEVFLVHPGGPFWAKKDLGAWTLPKGEYAPEEDPLDAAKREFHEETGFLPHGDLHALGTIAQSGGKLVSVWTLEGDCDPAALLSNRFQLEWPPHSGNLTDFPEVDRGEWFSLTDARTHILQSQIPLLDRLVNRLEDRL